MERRRNNQRQDMEVNMSTVLARNCDFTTDDCTLPVGRCIMTKGLGFTCVNLNSDNGLTELCTFKTDLIGTTPVSIGHGFYCIGRQIFKFGKTDALFEIPDETHLDGFGMRIWYQKIIQAISDTEVIHVRTTGSLMCFTLPDLIIRIYAVDEAGVVTVTEKTAKLSLSSMMTLCIYQGYLVLVNDFYDCLLVDYRTGTVVDRQDLPRHPRVQRNGVSLNLCFIDNGRKLGVFFKDNAKVNELAFQFDIVDGKIALTRLEYCADRIYRVARKTFSSVTRRNVICTAYQTVVQGLVHVNSSTKSINGRLEPTDEEFLIYVPTQTVLPIVGPKLNKNIVIRGVLTSCNGAYMAVMVSLQNMHNHHQLCIIDLKTGKTEHYFVNSMDVPSIVGYSQGNQAIIYNATVKCIPQVIQQPIFKERLNAMAVRLHALLFEQLPLEVVMNITDFVDHDIRKRL